MAATGGVIGWLRDAADFVLYVGGALLFLAAAVVLALAVRRAWKQSRRTEVIVETLSDATGDPTTAAAVVGLTYRLREEVVAALPVLADNAKRAVQRAESDSTSPIRTLMREDIDRREALLGDITSSKNDLMQSMETMVPHGARGAYRVVAGSLLRPKEVRVLGVLQRLNDDSGGVGLSFNVNHVGAEQAASRITLWEDEDCEVGTKTVVERFHALAAPAARALACELLRQRLKVTMSERRRHRRRARRHVDGQVEREHVVEFLVGGSYQNAAHGSAPATKSFYELAARALRKSAERLDHFKLSYQLANTVGELGRRQGDDRTRAIELLSDSTRLFEEAKRKLPAAGLNEAPQRAEELRIRAALTMNACLLAELLPEDEAKAKSAANQACALTTVDPAEYELEGVLYNVACALAVAARVEALTRHGAQRERCLDQSKIWLLHAGARNDRWWTNGKADPDLCLLRGWIPDARRHLWEAGHRSDRDNPQDAESINARINEVVEALRPKFPPPPTTDVSANGHGSVGNAVAKHAAWRGESLKAILATVRSGKKTSPKAEPRAGEPK